MKVRCDVYLGDNSRLDLSFFSKRKSWLPFTGVYLEFVLKGVYSKQVDFQVASFDQESVVVTRHAWNRFFLNIQKTGTVMFEVDVGGEIAIEQQYTFNVEQVTVPLMFSIPSLFRHRVSDIRFFANRLSENMVNSTRVSFFTQNNLESLRKINFDVENDGAYWRFYELLFSILTERGINVYVTPFDRKIPYPLDMLPQFKEVLWAMMDRMQKFHVVWDLSDGLRKRELSSLVDSVINRYGTSLPMVVRKDMIDKLGGEGFAQVIQSARLSETPSRNERGVKIIRIKEHVRDFYLLRRFVDRMVELGYGIEYVYVPSGHNLHKEHFSMSRALYLGYVDSMGEAR